LIFFLKKNEILIQQNRLNRIDKTKFEMVKKIIDFFFGKTQNYP